MRVHSETTAVIASRAAREAGFSLTEVLVVILIIGLLSTVVLVNVLPALDQGRATKVQADIKALESGLEQFRLDLARYPTTEQGLEALTSPPAGLSNPQRYRQGGYVKSVPLDPWGNEYQYLQPGENGPIDIYSMGADGRLGGEGQDADIGNWQS